MVGHESISCFESVRMANKNLQMGKNLERSRLLAGGIVVAACDLRGPRRRIRSVDGCSFPECGHFCEPGMW